jgi:response regulator RpfG family c-di-GMP phosphodiesterase
MTATASRESATSLKALLLTHNRQFVVTFSDAVSELPFDWIVEDQVVASLDIIQRERFDYLLADCTMERGEVLINAARRSEPNHNSVIVGITWNPDDSGLAQLGADTYVGCSVERDLLAASIRDLLPLATHNQRRFGRCKVAMQVYIRRTNKELSCALLSLSEGGMMINAGELLSKFETFAIDLMLPGTKEIGLYGKVVWRGAASLTGVRFLGLTVQQKKHLRGWLALQSRQQFPQNLVSSEYTDPASDS